MAMGSEKNFFPAAVLELSAEMFDDARIMGLRRRLGDSGFVALVRLWCWAAKWRSDGSMHDISDDVMEQMAHFTAYMTGEPVDENVPGEFVKALRDLKILVPGDDGEPRLAGLGEMVAFHPAPRRNRGAS